MGCSTTHSWLQHCMTVSSESHNPAVKTSRERNPDKSCVGEAGLEALEERKVPPFPRIRSRLHYHVHSSLVTILTDLQKLHFWLNLQFRSWRCGVLTTDKLWSKSRSSLLIYQMLLSFYGKRILIFLFTTFRYRCSSWARLIQFSTTQLRALRFTLLLTVQDFDV